MVKAREWWLSVWVLVCSCWLLAGCASVPSGGKAAHVRQQLGTQAWKFVYYESAEQRSAMMPAPFFDTVCFQAAEKQAVISQTPFQMPMTVPVEMTADGQLHFRLPTMQGKPLWLRCQAECSADGGVLVLRDRGTAAMFVTEAALGDVTPWTGRWQVQSGASGFKELRLVEDGSLHLDDKPQGWWRSWRSAGGEMLSMMWSGQARRGGGTMVWQATVKENGALLCLAPYGVAGLMPYRGVELRRVTNEGEKR